MFKQSSKSHLNLLTLVAACVLFAAGSATAQYKGLKIITKVIDPTKEVLLANPAYNVDQCANKTPGCDWVNGALGANNSAYAEGDSVAFRVKLTNLTKGQTYSYTIQFDATDNPVPNHGYDYLTSYYRTVADADVCAGQIGNCPANPPVENTSPGLGQLYVSSANIPIDLLVKAGRDGIDGNADDVVQAPGKFWLFGGQITKVGDYSYTNGFNSASKVSITITFVAKEETVVLAWGGHISTRLDWGNKSAVAFSGKPYHMRNGGFCTPPLDQNGDPSDCKTGSMDMQISVADVTPITGVRIIKEVTVAGGVSSIAFPFISAGGAPLPANFALVDNNTTTDRITQLYPNNAVPGPITVVEDLTTLPNWQNTGITCSITSGGGTPAGTVVISAQQVIVNLTVGDFAECTFVNVAASTTAANGAISGRVMTQAGMGIRGALVTMFDASTNTTKMAMTNSFGYYRFVELPVENFYILNVSAKRYTFSNPQHPVQMHGDIADFNFTSDQ